jgi:hypothetical protein
LPENRICGLIMAMELEMKPHSYIIRTTAAAAAKARWAGGGL